MRKTHRPVLLIRFANVDASGCHHQPRNFRFGATVSSCQAITSEQNFTCSVVGGKAVAKGGTADMIDMPVRLTGAVTSAGTAKGTTNPGPGGTPAENPARPPRTPRQAT